MLGFGLTLLGALTNNSSCDSYLFLSQAFACTFSSLGESSPLPFVYILKVLVQCHLLHEVFLDLFLFTCFIGYSMNMAQNTRHFVLCYVCAPASRIMRNKFQLSIIINYCGQKSLRRNGVAIMVNKRVWNAVLGCKIKNDRMISVSKQTIQYHSNPSLCDDK